MSTSEKRARLEAIEVEIKSLTQEAEGATRHKTLQILDAMSRLASEVKAILAELQGRPMPAKDECVPPGREQG